jgi:recombination protein RecA
MMSKSQQAMQLLHGADARRLSEESLAPRTATPSFCMAELVGRFVELSSEGASCVLTLAMGLVLEAQRQSEPVAWLGSDASVFHPSDAAETGVDLEALVLVRIKSSETKLVSRIAVSAERLLRSGAFGLLVLDLGKGAVLPQPLQTRLLGLAQKHHAALVCLTEKRVDDPSLGSLVSLRAQAVRSWVGADSFACEARILKDKRRGPTWSEREVCRGPLGLR